MKSNLKLKSFAAVFLLNLYRTFLLKTDRRTYAALFNFKSLLIKSSARLSWDDDSFVVTDVTLPYFKYRIRHQRQCNLAYEYGIRSRASSLGKSYFLDQIPFKDGDLIVDCGANVGDLKLWFDLNRINVRYMAFEPSPVEFQSLKFNVAPQVAYNFGLWSEEGDLNFFVSSQGADSSLIEPREYDSVINVKVAKLSSFVSERIKCLKLEAEGAEPEILLGLGDKLDLVDYVAADLGYERGIAAESTLVPVTNYLLSRGFELVDVSHGRICALFRNTRAN